MSTAAKGGAPITVAY
ncbi:hypothetical protein YPPY89_1987, partial [Yersinia pestis PY-89]